MPNTATSKIGLHALVFWLIVMTICSASASAGTLPPVASRGDLASWSNQRAARAIEAFSNLPLSFEPNAGQADSRVKFLAHGPGYTLFLTGDEAVLALQAQQDTKTPSAGRSPSIMSMRLKDANPRATVSGVEELSGKSNYFVGNDPKKWRTDIPNYSKVRYRDVYPGVDLVYYGNQGRVEYDFVVAAGSDPQTISLGFETGRQGASPRTESMAGLRVDQSGNLLVPVEGSEIRLHKPVAYQVATDGHSRHLIEARYLLKSDGQVGIRLASYDKTRPLIIDPVLTFSSRLGGSSGVLNSAIAVDSQGNVYVSGTTSAFDFPVVNQISGACQGTCSTSFETVFVTKINAAGTALVYSSLIGGSTREQGSAIAVDGSGNAYLTGITFSPDFPQVNPIPGACVGACISETNEPAFITKVSAAGDALVYSSLIGGSNQQFANAIAVDSSGDAYITGVTESPDFPLVNQIPGACQGSCGTGSFIQTAFVTEVNAAGSEFVYSSLLGGSVFEDGNGIAVDAAGNAYVTGVTESTDFPRTNQISAMCPGTCGTGHTDGFITKISAQGLAIVYSSVFGGSGFDMGTAVAVDGSGNAYLTGMTQSTDFPAINPIKGACSKACGDGNRGDAFVVKINSTGTVALNSSLLGGNQTDSGTGIAVDNSGNTYITGTTQSTNFPRVKGACVGTCGATDHIFLANIDPAGTGFVYSTLIGGTAMNEGQGIALDVSGNVYLTGVTESADFPILNQIPGACVGSCGIGFNEATFIIKLTP